MNENGCPVLSPVSAPLTSKSVSRTDTAPLKSGVSHDELNHCNVIVMWMNHGVKISHTGIFSVQHE